MPRNVTPIPCHIKKLWGRYGKCCVKEGHTNHQRRSFTILNCGTRVWWELFGLQRCCQAVSAWKRLSFATPGPRLLPAPPRRSPVPDLLGWNSKIQGQRASLSFLCQRMCLLREEHRPLTRKKEMRDGPTYPRADRRRVPSAATGARVWRRGVRTFKKDETDVTNKLKLYWFGLQHAWACLHAPTSQQLTTPPL